MYLLREIAGVGFVAFALVLLARRREKDGAWSGASLAAFAFLGAYAAYSAFGLAHLALTQVRVPPLWDFKAFWMFGQVAASHHNVYDPASYQMYRAILNPANDVEFNTIAVNIGLPYPPPAVLMVYPLGLIANVSTAMSVWYAAIFGAMAACIGLLWRRFFAADGIAGLVIVSLLVLTLSATRMNVGLGQVTFFVLLLLLLFWGERTPWRAGMWLAPLIVLRPLFILLAIYFVVRRQWSALVSLAATSVLLLAISIPLLGPHGLATYFTNPPTQRYPSSYFIGTQCLYKLLATINPHPESTFSLAAHPLYDALALACLLAGTIVCAIGAKRQRDACLALLLALGLWLYPSTDTHYCVLLLVPIGVVWRYRGRLGLSSNAAIVFIVAQYLLLNVREGMGTTGLTIALDCVFFGVLALRPTAAGAAVSSPAVRAGLAPARQS